MLKSSFHLANAWIHAFKFDSWLGLIYFIFPASVSTNTSVIEGCYMPLHNHCCNSTDTGKKHELLIVVLPLSFHGRYQQS